MKRSGAETTSHGDGEAAPTRGWCVLAGSADACAAVSRSTLRHDSDVGVVHHREDDVFLTGRRLCRPLYRRRGQAARCRCSAASSMSWRCAAIPRNGRRRDHSSPASGGRPCRTRSTTEWHRIGVYGRDEQGRIDCPPGSFTLTVVSGPAGVGVPRVARELDAVIGPVLFGAPAISLPTVRSSRDGLLRQAPA